MLFKIKSARKHNTKTFGTVKSFNIVTLRWRCILGWMWPVKSNFLSLREIDTDVSGERSAVEQNYLISFSTIDEMRST